MRVVLLLFCCLFDVYSLVAQSSTRFTKQMSSVEGFSVFNVIIIMVIIVIVIVIVTATVTVTVTVNITVPVTVTVTLTAIVIVSSNP